MRVQGLSPAFLSPCQPLGLTSAWTPSAAPPMRRHLAPVRASPLCSTSVTMGLFLAQSATEGLVAVEQAGTFQPQVAPLPTAVALSILGVFFLLRQRTDEAISARATRLEAEESLRSPAAPLKQGSISIIHQAMGVWCL